MFFNAKFNFIKFIISMFLLGLLNSNGNAANYFVSTSGNDSNTGLSTENAWNTINFAVNNSTLQGGDTIFIMGGTYKERVLMSKSGTPNKRIFVKNYNHELPIIDGAGIKWEVNSYDGLLQIEGSYVTIEGLKIINAKAADKCSGIMVKGVGIKEVSINNCITEKTSNAGICVWGNIVGKDNYSGATNIIIENCLVTETCYGNLRYCDNIIVGAGVDSFIVRNCITNSCEIKPNDNQFSNGIRLSANVRNGKVYNNKIHSLVQSNGIQLWSDKSHDYNIEIYNNTIYNIGNYGISINCASGSLLHDTRIFNNLLYSVDWDAIKLDGYEAEVKSMYNLSVYHNTVSKCNMGSVMVMGYDISAEIKNNIFVDNVWNNGVYCYTATKDKVIIDNNLISSNIGRSYSNPAGKELNGTNVKVVKNVDFVNESINNYNLKQNSAAIDAATSDLSVDFDIENNPRPYGGKSDLGAFEYMYDPSKVTGITLDLESYTCNINDSIQLNPTIIPSSAQNKNLIWTVNDNRIASITSGGKLKAIGAGKTQFTVSTEENLFSFSAELVVKPNDDGKGIEMKRLEIMPQSATLSLLQDFSLVASVGPNNTSNTNTTWESLNPNIATISEEGVVTAVSGGPVLIICTNASKTVKDTCEITVLKNLLLNPGFEEDLEIGWYNHWNYSTMRTEEYKKIGKYGLQVGPSGGGRSQSLVKGIHPFGKYLFSADAMQDGAWVYDFQPVSSILIKCCNRKTKSVLEQINSIPIDKSIRNFKNLLFTFTTPANTDSLVIELSTSGGSQTPTYFFDNFSLREIGTVTAIDEGINAVVLQLYPNPLERSNLNIYTPGLEGEKQLDIFDISGKMVYQTKLYEINNQLDLREINAKGIYFVKVTSPKGVHSKKLIIM